MSPSNQTVKLKRINQSQASQSQASQSQASQSQVKSTSVKSISVKSINVMPIKSSESKSSTSNLWKTLLAFFLNQEIASTWAVRVVFVVFDVNPAIIYVSACPLYSSCILLTTACQNAPVCGPCSVAMSLAATVTKGSDSSNSLPVDDVSRNSEKGT